MIGRVFHSIRNNNGLSGIRANDRKATVMMVYKSPFASDKENYKLEQQLLRIYTKYYIKVNIDNLGRFWEEKENRISVHYEDEIGGF